ncbi:PAS/PAC sensor signal transduction histidine kinase [Bacillus sp. OV322]|uniref:two-component system sensor histidine kinase NtrB n=1 Tax=Bacillus sp. OV322 TaxID=1882764 RepID=UPI0008F33F06|nr:ATP-binding protein [Bacillus sp. OV322]SFC64647.1 PAS/PAC sensor signal transduction histidine kinase [Bacillus sp. OV322]
MDNDQNYLAELKRLREENSFYKELIDELPFSFSYYSQKYARKLEKSLEESTSPVITETSLENTSDNNLLQISSAFDPLDEIEAILLPILDQIPHHIVFIDQKGYITLCNTQAAKDHGVDRGEITGKHIRDLMKIPDEKIMILESLRMEKELVNHEIWDRNYYNVNTKIIRNPDGSIKRVVGVFYFLHAIKEAEKQALAGRIAAGIAHEIRNPLTTVRGYLQLLQGNLSPEISELFTSLLIPEIDRANNIISEFLSIVRPAKTHDERLNVEEFFESYLNKFMKTQALLFNVEYIYNKDACTKNLYFTGDKEELLQVFMNLFQNSVQAKGNQDLKVNITLKKADDYIQFIFADNGQGIDSKILANIFDPFFSTKDYGTGLGLSVSRNIIESHNGMLSVSSNEDGTSFFIELPLAEETANLNS